LIKERIDIDIKSNKHMLVFVGRLEYQKGLDLLLDAFAQLPNKNNYQLLVLGNGSMKEQLIDQANRNKIDHLIHFLGFTNNPYKYIAKADFLISSSRFEGFPNVVIESLACGTPVIANNYLGGINEIICDRVGSVIDINDVKMLSMALQKEYNSEEIKLYCKQKYSVDKIIREYEMVFNL
jgi:glycosyltransferase involved in cell wall biosynthesis